MPSPRTGRLLSRPVSDTGDYPTRCTVCRGRLVQGQGHILERYFSNRLFCQPCGRVAVECTCR